MGRRRPAPHSSSGTPPRHALRRSPRRPGSVCRTHDDGRVRCTRFLRPRACTTPLRARRLRCRLRRRPARAAPATTIVAAGAHRAAQPRPPRRLGRRAGHRRRCGHPDPGPRRVPARGRPASSCPPPARYAVGTAFLPDDRRRRRRDRRRRSSRSPPRRVCSVARLARRADPSRDRSAATARSVMPTLPPAVRRRRRHRPRVEDRHGLERLAFCLRKRVERETAVYFPSLSSRTLVYKGMLTTAQLDRFFPDLVDERVDVGDRARALAVLDQHVPVAGRSPTRTGSSRTTARSTRCKGNRNWMRAREALLASDLIPGDLEPALPDLHARTPPTRRPSTRCSSCCTSAAARCRTRC